VSRVFSSVLLLASITATPAVAAEHRHRVGAGESLETVAKNYYGASWKAVYISSRNDLDPKADASGKRVTVPASWTYKVRRGDSLAAIAKRFLGDTDRHKAIMQFNSIKNASDLAVGQGLLMPFHLFHSTKSGETLSSISRRYYRTTRRAGALKTYNDVDTLKAGQRLAIPIFDAATVDVKSRRYNATATKAKAAPPPLQPSSMSREDAQARLARGVSGFHAGLFEEACPDLDVILEANALDDAGEAQLFMYLGFCAVAFDDDEAARDYFGQWLDRDPKAQLDQVRTSPKILKAFYEASEARRKKLDDTEGGEAGP
jgi:LysM repeat protein